MSPFELDILLHYYGHADDHPHIHNPPRIWRETIDRFFLLELLRNAPPARDCVYEGTERLSVYVKALCSMPLPKQVWAMPETTAHGSTVTKPTVKDQPAKSSSEV